MLKQILKLLNLQVQLFDILQFLILKKKLTNFPPVIIELTIKGVENAHFSHD